MCRICIAVVSMLFPCDSCFRILARAERIHGTRECRCEGSRGLHPAAAGCRRRHGGHEQCACECGLRLGLAMNDWFVRMHAICISVSSLYFQMRRFVWIYCAESNRRAASCECSHYMLVLCFAWALLSAAIRATMDNVLTKHAIYIIFLFVSLFAPNLIAATQSVQMHTVFIFALRLGVLVWFEKEFNFYLMTLQLPFFISILPFRSTVYLWKHSIFNYFLTFLFLSFLSWLSCSSLFLVNLFGFTRLF